MGELGMRFRLIVSAIVMALAALPVASARADDNGGFLSRFIDAYGEHLKFTGEGVENPPFRGIEPPLESPPFPGSDYSYGGSEVIGHTAPYGGPLTDAIYGSEWGQSMKNLNITTYGWAEVGGNISSMHNKYSQSMGTGGNYPIAYDGRPNSISMDQLAWYVERVPDEVQQDHTDWGFRFASLYGEDYRFTFAHDNASSQRLKEDKLYGYDICLMCYAEYYIPYVADGMQIRAGRYISIPDVEAQLAPNNYTYTHSLLYAYDPYTHTGMVASIKLDNNWSLQFEVSAGNDVMPWDTRYARVTPGACAEWTNDSGSDVIYPCLNGINSGRYGYNNVQDLVTTWYHKFDSKWHSDTEFWYMYQDDVPNLSWNGKSGAQEPLILGANGAYCGPAKPNCFTREYALVNYISYEVNHMNSISMRNEFMNDVNGQRTGIPTLYSEHMIGWQHWIGDVITIRPEILYAKSYNHPAFDGSPATWGAGGGSAYPNGIAMLGSANHIVLFSSDIIVHF